MGLYYRKTVSGNVYENQKNCRNDVVINYIE